MMVAAGRRIRARQRDETYLGLRNAPSVCSAPLLRGVWSGKRWCQEEVLALQKQ